MEPRPDSIRRPNLQSGLALPWPAGGPSRRQDGADPLRRAGRVSVVDLWRTRPDGAQARRRVDRERPRQWRPRHDNGGPRHRIRSGLFCPSRDPFRRPARPSAPARRRSPVAGPRHRARGATGALYTGGRDPAIWLKLIERIRATIFAAAPSVYRQILKYGDPSAFDLSSLRRGVSAGEALSPDLLAHWHDATGTWLYEALGMSEISTFISSRPGEPIRPGSPGRPQTGRRIVILPSDGGAAPLPPAAIGLLAAHRSDPGLMLGYLNRPAEQAAPTRRARFIGCRLAGYRYDGLS